MPLNRVPLTGNQIVAMANVSRQLKSDLTSPGPGDTSFDYSEINVLGLPSLLYWVRLDSPVANVRFTPLFAVTNRTAGVAPTPNWAEFTNGAILVPGNITVFTIRAAVAVMGIRITVPAGNTISISTILTAGG
jgi:hypothetical protein